MHKGCKLYAILALNQRGVVEGLEQLSMVREYADIFLKDLPRMSSEREWSLT
jgi:hypothetical protein